MSERHDTISLISPNATIRETLPLEEAIKVIERHAPPDELQVALEFLEMARMAEGCYKGTNWSIGFSVADDVDAPATDEASEAGLEDLD